MTKCLKCENEAKWKSTKYDSPLCSECAKKFVDELFAEGKITRDERSVSNNFYPIDLDFVPIGME